MCNDGYPKECPNCHGSFIAKILWGKPHFTDKLKEDLNAGRVVLGGCMVSLDDAKWHCNDCNTDFGTSDFVSSLLELMHDINEQNDPSVDA